MYTEIVNIELQTKCYATKIDKIFNGRCSVNQIIQVEIRLFFLNISISRHLKLEIVLNNLQFAS